MPTIRRGFCPICFRGHHLETARVPPDSPCIDAEQRDCSKLPLLDLARAGERCRQRCRQICMVCANPMAFPCEPDYDEALDAVDRHEEDVLELRTEVLEGMRGLLGSLGESMLKDAERRLDRRLRRIGMAWHPRWRKAVHARCLKKEQCGCVLTASAGECSTHRVKKLKVRATLAPSMPPPAPTSVSPQTSRAAPASTRQSQRSWLPTPAATVAIHLAHNHGPPAPRPSKGKPPPAKPNSKLLHAAKGCGKIDGWRKGESQQSRVLDPTRGRPPFDMTRYEREFDPFLHGYFRKNGVDFFRFPDGWVEQVFSPVNRITDDGHIVPG